MNFAVIARVCRHLDEVLPKGHRSITQVTPFRKLLRAKHFFWLLSQELRNGATMNDLEMTLGSKSVVHIVIVCSSPNRVSPFHGLSHVAQNLIIVRGIDLGHT
jgi:hypothetical protein